MNWRIAQLTGLLLCLLVGVGAAAQNAPQPGQQPQTVMPDVTIPAEAQPSDHFDPVAATNAYLAQIPATARARSDAYFEGGYWLILWDFLYAVVMYFVLLKFRWSAAMRNLAERLTRFKPVQTFLYFAIFSVVTFVLGAPIGIYEGYTREHKYGLATQTFGPWAVDQLKGLLVGIILGGILAALLFGVVRRWPNTWHIRGAVVAILFSIFAIAIAPVLILPLFNTVKRLDDPRVTGPILRLAHANGIATNDVYEIDASKQTTRMSANVSGFGKTMRITLNDNLLKRGSPEEIQSVMGHEMGHYVLHHIYKDILFISIVIVVFFALLKWFLDWMVRRKGEAWQIRGIGDTTILPLVFLFGTTFSFVFTPIQNTETRVNEFEADMYGLNASRQPDGFAQAAIHLGEYRKMDPGPIEEFIFYDHPSGRNRIYAAMRWKAENLPLFTPQIAPQTKP